MVRWIVTRERGEDSPELRLMRAAGAPFVEVPCLESLLAPWPWADVNGVTVFTSRRAVDSWAVSQAPKPSRVVALAPMTAAHCRAAGLEPELEIEGGVVALAQAMTQRWAWSQHGLEVRYPTSPQGLESAEQRDACRVLASWARVDRRLAYEVRAPKNLPKALAPMVREPWGAVFASPSTVEHFLGACATDGLAPAHVACHGASTARAWDQRRPPSWPTAVDASHLEVLLRGEAP